MASEWIETTIGDQITLQRGIDITRAAQRAGNVPVLSSGGVSSYHDTSAAHGPGVVLGRKGVVGSVYYVGSDYWPHDTTLWVKDFHGNHPRFVYYFFLCMAPQLARMDVGSANPTLNRNHIHPRWDIYFTQVGPICCGRWRRPLRSASPWICTATVRPPRLAQRVVRRVFLGCGTSVG